jgi:hypothetical protein
MAGPSLELRQQIVAFARRYVGAVDFSKRDSDGRPIGIDLLKEIFEISSGLYLQDKDFKKANKSWTWLPKGINWCGMFVVYCYRMNGLTDISWNLATGKPQGPIVAPKWSPNWRANMQIGDMGAVSSLSHHFLIADLPGAKANRFRSIDGNGTWGAITACDPSKLISGTHGFGIDRFYYYSLL